MTSITATAAMEIAIDVSARPRMSTIGGTGVARRRLRTPAWRWPATVISSAMNEDVRIASAMIPGTKACCAVDRLTDRLDGARVAVQPGEDDEQQHRQRDREEHGPPVAERRADVEAQLVQDEGGGHAVSSR